MKRTLIAGFVVMCLIILQLYSCKRDPSFDQPVTTADNISFSVPSGWPQPYYTFQNNTLTKSGFELGRKIFYDTRLSKDNTVSCGTCHQQYAAFANLDHEVSHGYNNLLGTRNAPPLFNLNWHTSFFWDGGVNNIENQPINPIQNPVEMAGDMNAIIAMMNADATYKNMFTAAFGTNEANSQRIFKALTQFMCMMISCNSKYDKHMHGDAGGEFTDQETRGLAVFRSNCAACHKEPLFSDFSYRNNGLQPTVVNDSGRAHITKDTADLYKFLVPSLRNLTYSRPYMHDGRFGSINDVLTHYTTGIYQSSTLDPLLKSGIKLTEQDKQDLMAFLKTLDDPAFLADARFSEALAK